MDGIALDVYEIYVGDIYKTTVYVEKREDAERIAYLLDGEAVYQMYGVLRPE